MHTFPMRAKDNWVLSKNYIIYKWLNISNGYNNIKIKKKHSCYKEAGQKSGYLQGDKYFCTKQ